MGSVVTPDCADVAVRGDPEEVLEALDSAICEYKTVEVRESYLFSHLLWAGMRSEDPELKLN